MSTNSRINDLHLRLLIPIWGKSYIDRFFQYCAASILNQKNAELFKQYKSCEVIFLTDKESTYYIKSLDGLYPIKFRMIEIDDLMNVHQYGVILTLAYTRGIQASGTNQVNTAFIMMNADFVFSSEAIQFISEKLNAGYNGVLCPSMRCIEELVLDKLPNNDCSARELVKLCLDDMHPTMAANFIDQDLVYSTNNLAIHSHLSGNAIASISFNPFMLCIKPETEYLGAEGYCDFDFVPAMIPSDNYYFVQDSDEVFILELAGANQEHEFVQFMPSKEHDVLHWMSLIITKERLKYCDYVHVMHTEDLSATNLPQVSSRLKSHLASILDKIPAGYFDNYVLHNNHPFWTFIIHHNLHKGHLDWSLKELRFLSDLSLEEMNANEKKRLDLVNSALTEDVKEKILSVKDLLQNVDGHKIIVTNTPDEFEQQNIKSINLMDLISSDNPITLFANQDIETIVFCVSRVDFDFYRENIYKLINDCKEQYKVLLVVPFSGNNALSIASYSASIYNYFNDVSIKMASVYNFHPTRNIIYFSRKVFDMKRLPIRIFNRLNRISGYRLARYTRKALKIFSMIALVILSYTARVIRFARRVYYKTKGAVVYSAARLFNYSVFAVRAVMLSTRTGVHNGNLNKRSLVVSFEKAPKQ